MIDLVFPSDRVARVREILDDPVHDEKRVVQFTKGSDSVSDFGGDKDLSENDSSVAQQSSSESVYDQQSDRQATDILDPDEVTSNME